MHYLREGDVLIPAAETEFAKDPAFGYESSDLKAWVEEKTAGKYPASGVTSISIEHLRKADLDFLAGQLMAVADFNKVIVNADQIRSTSRSLWPLWSERSEMESDFFFGRLPPLSR